MVSVELSIYEWERMLLFVPRNSILTYLICRFLRKHPLYVSILVWATILSCGALLSTPCALDGITWVVPRLCIFSPTCLRCTFPVSVGSFGISFAPIFSGGNFKSRATIATSILDGSPFLGSSDGEMEDKRRPMNKI